MEGDTKFGFPSLNYRGGYSVLPTRGPLRFFLHFQDCFGFTSLSFFRRLFPPDDSRNGRIRPPLQKNYELDPFITV